MSDAPGSARAEMLAAARKKLKDFESRQKVEGRNSPASSIISSEPGGGVGLNGRSSVISEDSSALQASARNGVSASPFQPNGNEWYQAYTQLKAQHDELCSHYAQLHTAYSQVNADGVHIDAENQIVQLQTALSSMVDEKLACQSDLRQANEQIEDLRKQLAANTSSTSSAGSEQMRNLQEAIAQKDALLSARHQELESARREVAEIQTNLLNVQHERSEAQARVKSLIKETGVQEIRVEQLKKDNQMKDLYLKQLGASGATLPAQQNNSEQLESEISALKTERSRLLTEISTLKSHYSEREHHLRQKQDELAQALDKAQIHIYTSDGTIQQLQHELEVITEQKTATADAETVVVGVSDAEISKRIHEACKEERGRWQVKLDEEQRNREEETLEKDRVIFEREQSLAELEMKYRILEERTLESTANGADLLSLSEQLQNEKATVSRAVAQNKELKERLLETEDRFVALTEEKAAIELEKQSAEHQVKELTKQLNLEAAGLVNNIAEVIASQPHLDPAPLSQDGSVESEELKNALESLKQENAEIRENLELKTQELLQTRADLRRSTTHNEQMDEIMRQNAEDENQNSIHVELTQAVTRVQELAAENEQLREALSEIRQQLEQEREEIELIEVIEEPKKPETPPLHEDLWARKELEKRFARAMLQNAELVENIDRLEHINQQLELENDTIADHVVLYQHQRKLVRERLRLKDQQLKTMEEERVKTVARCQELQNVLMTVLNKEGVLKRYQTNNIGRKAARRVSRSYSHSTVDELSGDEDIVVDGRMQDIPPRVQVHGGPTENENTEMPGKMEENGEKEETEVLTNGEIEKQWTPENADESVLRLFEIISDISKPPIVPTGQLHCTQCIGPLQDL